jgi:SAM-dependent methyltransferase
MSSFPPRRNLVERTSERWKPRPHSAPSAGGGLADAARRLFDIQFGSISNDARTFLRTVQGRLLDVGCGDQPFRDLVPPGVEYTGIDRLETRSDFDYSNRETRYFTGDRWPVSSESYDAIMCTEVLEHVSEPRAFLSEAYRCLAPAGRVFLTVPFAARWHYIPHDYWRFTPSCLLRLFTSCGFESVEVYCRGDEVTVACYKSMALILPLLFPQGATRLGTILRRSAGALLVPAFVVLALVANLSLRVAREADDCIGYTVIASKRRGLD